jgi:hypothetical protein
MHWSSLCLIMKATRACDFVGFQVTIMRGQHKKYDSLLVALIPGACMMHCH